MALTDLLLDNAGCTAEPGVILRFTSGKKLKLKNTTTISFIGTPSQPIRVEGEAGAPWGGIILETDAPAGATTANHVFERVVFANVPSEKCYNVRYFNNGSSVAFRYCTVNGGGIHIADGTSGGMAVSVEHTSLSQGAVGDTTWAGLFLSGDDPLDDFSVLDCQASWYGTGMTLIGGGIGATSVQVRNNHVGLRTSGNPSVDSGEIMSNGTGVVVSPPTTVSTFPLLTHLRIVSNSGPGIRVDSGGNARVNDCLIHDNSGPYDVVILSDVFEVTTIDFQNCYWGRTTTQEMIAEGTFSDIARISDWWEDDLRSLVEFTGFAVPGLVDATTIVPAQTAWGAGAAWIDYDGDSDDDLFLVNDNATPPLDPNDRFLRNDGPSFSIPANTGAEGSGLGAGMAWADYDNDGDLDVYIVNRAGADALYRNDAPGVFHDATSAPLGHGGNDTGISWVDYDRDGFVDLHLTTDVNLSDVLYRNQGNGTFLDVTPEPLRLRNDHGITSAWADYDLDGDQDVFVSSEDGADHLIRNNGGGSFADVTPPVLNDPGITQGAAWGDFDNDQDPDLYVCNWESANKLFRNDRTAGFRNVTTGPLGDTGRGQSGTWSDFDNDRDMDLFLANFGLGPNRLLRNDGNESFTEVSGPWSQGTAATLGAAWGDYDRDGDEDLYLSNRAVANVLYRNDQFDDGNHWLQIALTGVAANRAAIGARIQVITGAVVQTREIGGNKGMWSHNSLVQSFGLGSATQADVVIYWPNAGTGNYQRLFAVSADQRLSIVQASTVAAPLVEDVVSGWRLFGGAPNPFSTTTTVRYEVPRESRVTLRVYDVQGRLVRTLAEGLVPTGCHAVTWDGRTDAGGQASPGVYFYRLRTPGSDAARKVVLLR